MVKCVDIDTHAIPDVWLCSYRKETTSFIAVLLYFSIIIPLLTFILTPSIVKLSVSNYIIIYNSFKQSCILVYSHCILV